MNLLRYRLGFALRESGQALERVGCRLQGVYDFQEEVTRLRSLVNLGTAHPKVSDPAFVAPTAVLLGDVEVGAESSVWYNCVLRGDIKPVSIGSSTNIQDGALVGATSPTGSATTVGDGASIGHNAVLSGCTVEGGSLIGMGAILKDGCKVQSRAIVAAGAVVEPGTIVPSGEVWGGNPARKLRDVKEKEAKYLEDLPSKYVELSHDHGSVMSHLQKQMQSIAGTTV